jgi:hypothetical protein
VGCGRGRLSLQIASFGKMRRKLILIFRTKTNPNLKKKNKTRVLPYWRGEPEMQSLIFVKARKRRRKVREDVE